MNFLKRVFFLSLVITAPYAQAEILKIHSIKELKAIVDKEKPTTPSDLLLLLDIDMTLTEPEVPAATYPFLKKYKEVFKKILDSLSPEEQDLLGTYITQKLPQHLIEKESPTVIKELQKAGIKIIGFTAALTGQFKGFKQKALFEKRDILQKKGIDFMSAFNDRSQVITFTDYSLYCGFFPTFYHGLLSSNGEGKFSKGEVLISFLKHVGKQYDEVMTALKKSSKGYYPKVVVMVDDREKNLESVEEALKKHDSSIKFIGLHYFGSQDKQTLKEVSEKEFCDFWTTQINQARKM